MEGLPVLLCIGGCLDVCNALPLPPWGCIVCMEQCESAAALLESVREQEVQFEQLTRALEEERRRVGLPATSPSALGRPLPHTQVTSPNKPEPPWSQSLVGVNRPHLAFTSNPWIIISSTQPSKYLHVTPVKSSFIPLPPPELVSTSAQRVWVHECLCKSSSGVFLLWLPESTCPLALLCKHEFACT